MASLAPRAVVVTRPSEYEQLLARHATAGQAAFFLEQRGQRLEPVRDRHEAHARALATVSRALPRKWRRTQLLRAQLGRFHFEAEDVVIVVGQDGLVANVSKYLAGQPVIGVNPDRRRNAGVLVPFEAGAVHELLGLLQTGRVRTESRTMVEARLDDGQRLLALNEIFIGVRSHQSARYRLRFRHEVERQSSSGLIVATGTGATGWALSIRRERGSRLPVPNATDRRLSFFVREAYPSVSTGAELTEGVLEHDEALEIRAEMEQGGVLFGDGIEDDCVALDWGQRVKIGIAERRLELVQA